MPVSFNAQIFLVERLQFVVLLPFEAGASLFGAVNAFELEFVMIQHDLAALLIFILFLFECVHGPLEFDFYEVPIVLCFELFQSGSISCMLLFLTFIVRILPVRGIRHVLDAEILGCVGLLLLALLLLDPFVGELGFEFRTGLSSIVSRGEAGFEECDFEGQQFVLVLLLRGDFSVGELLAELLFLDFKIRFRNLRFVFFQFEEFVGELYFEF